MANLSKVGLAPWLVVSIVAAGMVAACEPPAEAPSTEITTQRLGTCGDCLGAQKCVMIGQFTFWCDSQDDCMARGSGELDLDCATQALDGSSTVQPIACGAPPAQPDDLAVCSVRRAKPAEHRWLRGGATAWAPNGGELTVERAELFALVGGQAVSRGWLYGPERSLLPFSRNLSV